MKTELKKSSYIHNGESHAFEIKQKININAKANFVNDVLNYVVSENGYLSVLRGLIFDFTLINYFTDINIHQIINELTNGDDSQTIDTIESFLDDTSIANMVKISISKDILFELENAVDDAIAYKTGIHKNDVTSLLSNLIRKIDSQLSNIDISKTNEMIDMFKNLKDNKSFKEFTPEKLVDIYFKSDEFKENREKIIEDKNNEIIKLKEIINSKKASTKN